MEPPDPRSAEARPVGEVLARLEGVRRVASGWLAQCPAHDDRQPSLSISENEESTALLHCHAGCSASSVVEAIGLTLADLFPAPNSGGSRIAATYDYFSADGAALMQVVRFEPKRFRQRRWTGTRWAWGLGRTERVLYGLPELLATPRSEVVLVVEGEKDVDRLRALGLTATTNPGGAGKWRPSFNEALRGRPVVIVPDNDDAGRRHAASVREALIGIADSLSVIELPGLRRSGDVSDWLDNGGGAEGLRALISDTDESKTPEIAEKPGPQYGDETFADVLDGCVRHLARFVHFSRPEHTDAIALWVAHTHARLDRIEQSPILALTSAVKRQITRLRGD